MQTHFVDASRRFECLARNAWIDARQQGDVDAISTRAGREIGPEPKNVFSSQNRSGSLTKSRHPTCTLRSVMTVTDSVDILKITYRRPHYTRLTLERLLATCNENMRVWVWHNGDHAETLEVVRGFEGHPRLHRFHHCPENLRLRAPTNWLFSESRADFVSKIDDDCMMPFGWAETLVTAMQDEPRFGVLSCWHFQEEDYDPVLAAPKMQTFGRHQILRNMWVAGSGFLLRRTCVEQAGLLRDNEFGFSAYCTRIALAGNIVGWYWPPVRQLHLDDPREPLTAIKSDEDLLATLPLSAIRNGIRTRADWIARLKRSALEVQSASIDPRYYSPWRRKVRNGIARITRALRLARLNS